MSILDNDLNICYSGGSGGFYLLHLLLLSGKHWCYLSYPDANNEISASLTADQLDQLRVTQQCYESCAGDSWPSFDHYYNFYPNVPDPAKSELSMLHKQWAANTDYINNGFDIKLKSIIKHQWNISQLSKWKQNEVWPENSSTLNNPGPGRYKIYFTCIPPDLKEWPQWPGKKILLYTDIKSQIRLSSSKRAGMFNPDNNLLKQGGITRSVIKKTLRNTYQYNNQDLPTKLKALVDTADRTIYLQDLIQNFESTLGVCATAAQQDFTRHWIRCHPAQLLTKIGIKQ